MNNLVHRAGPTGVATSPCVMEPADEKTGSHEPLIDAAAGSVRLLEYEHQLEALAAARCDFVQGH